MSLLVFSSVFVLIDFNQSFAQKVQCYAQSALPVFYNSIMCQ